MRGEIDCRDLAAVTKTRRAILEEIAPYVPDEAERFAIEQIAGEVLGAQAANGGESLSIELETAQRCVILDVWGQGPPLALESDALRDALLHALTSYIDVEPTATGNHLTVRVPVNLTTQPEHSARIWRLVGALTSDRGEKADSL